MKIRRKQNGVSQKEGRVTEENIGEYVLPFVEYVHQIKPDYIIANDLGARIIGVTVAMLYRRVYGALPTVNRCVHFRRISTENGYQETKEHLQHLVEDMLKHRENPLILIFDDCVSTGETKQVIYSIFEELSEGKIDTRYGVLLGKNVDVSSDVKIVGSLADTIALPTPIIGVNYKGTAVYTTPSPEARGYRQKIAENLDKLVGRLYPHRRISYFTKLTRFFL